MPEIDKSLKRPEKAVPKGLSLKNRFRYYGSLLGVTGLAALAAAGCGESSSSSSTSSPNSGGNTPGETQSNPGAETDENQTTFPPDTAITVTLYASDGSGETYEEKMPFGEIDELCEEERQEIIQRAEEVGEEIIAGPQVTLPYTVDGAASYQEYEFTCGDI